MANFFIKSVALQDIRCFHGDTKIILKNPTIFVGGNDTGKSSIFKVLDVFFNHLDIEKDKVEVKKEYINFLMPKYCDRAHSSKRICIEIGADDNRLLRNMTRDEGTTELILTVTWRGCKLELNECHRNVTSDKAAINLYQRLKKNISFVYIPSLRDVSGDIFNQNLTSLLNTKVFEEIYPQQAGGTPTGYRQIKNFLIKYKEELKTIANSGLLKAVQQNIPIPVSQDITFDVDMDESEILKWSLEKIRIVKPARAAERVDMPDMGTGVLSSLSLAILFTNKVSTESGKLNIIAIEEPEAFVHPHYQRSLFGRLLKNVGSNHLLVSTHSPAIIDRQHIGNISIVTRNSGAEGSKIWQIGSIRDMDEEIFTAHANFQNSELFFSDLVVLVEGSSEKLVLTHLFDKLPLELKELFSGISIIDVGGNAHFGPFIRLLKSFGKAGKEFPIKWLVFTDRDSIQPGLGQPIIRALRESGYAHIDYNQINTLLNNPFTDDADGFVKVRQINAILKPAKSFINLADLEYSLITQKNFRYIKKYWKQEKAKGLITLDLPVRFNDALTYLGSKGLRLDKQYSETGKKPFVHAKIMRWTKLKDVSDIYKDFLKLVAEELTEDAEYLRKLSQVLE